MNAAFLLVSSALLGAQPPAATTPPAAQAPPAVSPAPVTSAPVTSAPISGAPAVVSTGSGCCGGSSVGGWSGGCGGCGCDDACGGSTRRGLLSRLGHRRSHEDCGCETSCAPVSTCGCESERMGLCARLKGLFSRRSGDCGCGGFDGGCGCDGGYASGYSGGCGGSVIGHPTVGGTITTQPGVITTQPGGETIPAPKGSEQKPLPSGTTPPGTTPPAKPSGSLSLSTPYNLSPTITNTPATVEAPRNPF